MLVCKAEMFNTKASSSKAKPDEIMKALDIKPSGRIADIGSGGGYFSMRFAEAVGRTGEVYTVDTNREFLDYVEESSRKAGMNNLRLTLATDGSSNLPDNSFDLIFLRNVYHHIIDRINYMRALGRKLKSGGKIAIIEYKPGGNIFSTRRLFGHNVPEKKIISEMRQAGYKVNRGLDFLPEQSFTIFSID